ncbi:MAG TPA: TonB-dependent receptor, partial [Thermoanaerobaculia bacterium]
DRNFRFVSIKQDWARDFSDRHLLKWGAELKAEDASYDYGRTQPEGEVHVDLEQSGESYAAYVADRFRIGNSVVAELGLRWDKQFWTEDQQLAPRLNVRYAHRSGTLLRAAWGRYHQWEQLNELPVEDGVSDFRTAQRADHILLSVERAFGNGLAVRVDAYEKQLRNSRPRFENLWSSLELFPEAERDRVLVAPDEGRSRGIELLVKGDPARPLSWWGGYTLSKAVDVIDGRDVPRSWDQRHAVTFGVNRRLPRGWNVNLAGTYHSGRPTTPAALDDDGEPVPLERNSARLPDYHRFDARVTRAIVSRFGEITFTAEVLNLTGRANVCCVNEFSQEEGRVVPEYRYWPRVIPSFSIRWRR